MRPNSEAVSRKQAILSGANSEFFELEQGLRELVTRARQIREVRDEELRKLKAMRRRFLTAELSDEEAERIASSRMEPRHDHLDKLLDPK